MTSSPATPPAALRIPVCAATGWCRIDAMIGLADRLGASTLVTGHYARIVDDGEGPLLVAPADLAKDQTYMLAGVRDRLVGAAAISARRAHQARGAPDRGRRGPPGRLEEGEPGPVLSRGRGQALIPRSPRRARRRGRGGHRPLGTCARLATAATITSPSASGAGSASPRRAALRARDRRRLQSGRGRRS